MKSSRRSILKSGVAGLVAAGSGAAAGVAQETSSSLKAVIINSSVLGWTAPGQVTLFTTVLFESPNGGPGITNGTFAINTFNSAEALAENIPQILNLIEANGGARLQASDLLFVGFDFLRG